MFHVEQIKKFTAMKKICGNLVLVKERVIKPGCIEIDNGIIKNIIFNTEKYNNLIMPGFIDSHVHIESSMLIPEKFSELAIQHGTVAVITDPHEIANVLGIDGIKFMIENAKKAKIKIFFMAPSCVPATSFETSGAIITANEIEKLYKEYPDEILGLAEVMNYPGVIYNDPEIHAKLNITKNYNKKIDGHAPMLSGENLKKYIKAGIETDHECSTLEEALEKINLGMKIQIREGSAAKDYENLKNLIKTNPDDIMFCTDDSHPDELIEKGEIDKIVRYAIKDGYNIHDILKAANRNAIKHYNIPVGKLEINDPADFIITDSLAENFKILKVFIDGEEKYNIDYKTDNQHNKLNIQHNINKFRTKKINITDIELNIEKPKANIIVAEDGSLLTKKDIYEFKTLNRNFESDTDNDILKIVVLNRYDNNSKPAIGLIKGFNLKNGSIASTVAHDSHNIVAVGTNDEDLTNVINLLIENKGGLAVYNKDEFDILKLPIAGLMTFENGNEVASKYKKLNKLAAELGCKFKAPFMTLAFMSLLVIPEIKLSDKGLFDNTEFKFIDLFVN